jgi:hypothetical protein
MWAARSPPASTPRHRRRVPSTRPAGRLDGPGGQVGTEVSAEEDLGLKERNDLPAILASVRPGARWRIEAEHISLERESSRTLNRTINWGDNSYTLGTTASASLQTEIYRLSVGYSLVKDAQMEIGVAPGLHATDSPPALLRRR